MASIALIVVVAREAHKLVRFLKKPKIDAIVLFQLIGQKQTGTNIPEYEPEIVLRTWVSNPGSRRATIFKEILTMKYENGEPIQEILYHKKPVDIQADSSGMCEFKWNFKEYNQAEFETICKHLNEITIELYHNLSTSSLRKVLPTTQHRDSIESLLRPEYKPVELFVRGDP